MIGTGYDNYGQAAIGCDLLDIGSRRAEQRRCQDSAGSHAPPTLSFGEPGAFDLPNVQDVSSELH